MEYDLRELRGRLKLNQHEMAHEMGMSFRAYQDIEGGQTPVRPIHSRAAERAAIAVAARLGDASLLPGNVRKEIRRLVS